MPRTAMTAALLVAALFGFSCELMTEEKAPVSRPVEDEPILTAPREPGSRPSEVRIKLSRAEGGEVRIVLNRAPRADLNELAATLATFVEMEPGLVIVIDAQKDVPFNWVFGVWPGSHNSTYNKSFVSLIKQAVNSKLRRPL